MKRIIQFSAVILTLALVLGGISQPAKGQEHEPAPIHTPSDKTGYDKTASSENSVGKSNSLSAQDAPPIGMVTLGAWRNMRPTESYLRDVSMLPKDVADNVNCTDPDQQSKGWIVGDAGVILAYCHGIWDHAIITQSIFTDLYGVAAITPTLAFAVGAYGTIEQYGWDVIEKKYTWVKLSNPVSAYTLNRISVVPNGSGYFAWVVGDQDGPTKRSTLVRGTIVPSGDYDPQGHPIYNSNWTNVTNVYGALPQTNMYFGVQALDMNNAWTVASEYTNWKGYAMHWNGTTWSPFLVGNDPLYGVHFRSANNGWAVGEGGGIYHFNGSSWSKEESPVDTPLADVSFDSDGNGWAIGFDGVIIKYPDENGKWFRYTDMRTDYFDFYALDHTSGHGWMVGYDDRIKNSNGYGIGGQILEYYDNNWLSVTVPTDNSLNDLSIVSDNDAWAVGAADQYGATIIHWDGRHWQRWFQPDSPLPAGDLYAIDMLSATNGWAAGEPPTYGAPAVFLHWNGRRWEPPRYLAPVNVRVNSLRLFRTNIGTQLNPIMKDFGWAVANSGNALAKYNYAANVWDANHTFGGLFYQLRGLSLIPSTAFQSEGRDWDAWAVGEYQNNGYYYETFMRFLKEPSPSTGSSWQEADYPSNCPDDQDPKKQTDLYSIRMLPITNDFPTLSGYASGNFNTKDSDQRASIYQYNGSHWETIWCQPKQVSNPSQLNSVDSFEDTHITWFGGYYTSANKKVAFIAYIDQSGYVWGGIPYPLNGLNIYDRPISRLRMSNETMGWAVGEREDPLKRSAIFQYPYPNFILNLSPEIGAVRPGTSIDITASLSTLGSIDNSINLSTLSIPSGFQVQISPATVTTSSSSNINIAVDPGVAPGEYLIPIRGYAVITSGDVSLPMERINQLKVIVTDHPVQKIDPEIGPAGTVVTLSGQNFGTVPSGQRNTSQNNVILAGARMPDPSIITWTDTKIQVRVPDDVTLFPNGPVKDKVQITATTGGSTGYSNGNLDFQLENQLTNATVTQDGTYYLFTLTGTSFGNDPGYLNRDSYYTHVNFDGTEIPYWDVWDPSGNDQPWNNNKIMFRVPMSTQINGKKISIVSNGYQSNEITYTSNNPHVFLPIVKR